MKIKNALMLFVLINITLLSGCCIFTRYPSEHPCNNVPEFVKSNISSHSKETNGLFLSSDKRTESIINGKHPELYMPKPGVLSSKKYGWTLKLQNRPFLYYENDGYVLVSLFSEYNYFSCYSYLKAVVRKQDGKLVNSVSSPSNIMEEIVFDDIYYFKLNDDPRIHSMKIGE